MEIDTSWSYTQEAFACACVDAGVTLVDTGVTNPEGHRLKRTVEDVCPSCEIPFTKISEHDYTKVLVTVRR